MLHKAQCRLEMRAEVPPPRTPPPSPPSPSVSRGLEQRVAACVAEWEESGGESARRQRVARRRGGGRGSSQQRGRGEQRPGQRPEILFDWWCDHRGSGCLRPEEGDYGVEGEQHRCYGYSNTIYNDGSDYVVCEACYQSGEARDHERLKLVAGPPPADGEKGGEEEADVLC